MVVVCKIYDDKILVFNYNLSLGSRLLLFFKYSIHIVVVVVVVLFFVYFYMVWFCYICGVDDFE